MRRFVCIALSAVALQGCATLDLFQPAPLPAPDATPVPVQAPAATVPPPTDVKALAQGLVEALSRGDVAQARTYYLSDEEFEALFEWSGFDPRPERNARIDEELQAAAVLLAGGTYKGLTEEPPQPNDFAAGRRFGNLLLEQSSSAMDNVTAVVEVGGQTRTVRLEGPIRVGSYWRLFSPTLAVR